MNANVVRRACGICGGSLGKEILRITDPDRFERHVGISQVGYRRSWVECSSCGAVTNVQSDSNRAKLSALAAGYYEVDFAGTTIGDKFALVMGLPPARSDNAQRVARIHRFMGDWLAEGTGPRKVLDIGAGTGVFLARFLEEAATPWSGTAVEPDPIAAEHLRLLRRFEVGEALFSRELGLRDFDLVTLNKVVEHLADPVELLIAARSALCDPLGVVYVEVPDKLTITHRPSTDNILGALHCHLYDPASVGVLLSRAGLVAIRIERFFEPSGKITVAAFATLPNGVTRLASAGECA